MTSVDSSRPRWRCRTGSCRKSERIPGAGPRELQEALDRHWDTWHPDDDDPSGVIDEEVS